MGIWAKKIFGQEFCGEIGIVIARTSNPEFEKNILSFFDEVLSSKDAAYHTHLVKKNGVLYPVVTNVYGAPAIVDVMAEMHDGGCRTVIFIGSAYGGFKNLDIGSIVIPDKSYHFEGVFHPLQPDRKAAFPDKDLKKRLEEVFKKNKISYSTGANISVPAVTLQLPHNNEEYKRIQPLTVEMELAACLARAKDIGIRAAGILIISDNRSKSIGDEKGRELRRFVKEKIIKIIAENLENFKLPKLPMEKEWSIDEHLASIIEDPIDKTNVYRNKK